MGAYSPYPREINIYSLGGDVYYLVIYYRDDKLA